MNVREIISLSPATASRALREAREAYRRAQEELEQSCRKLQANALALHPEQLSRVVAQFREAKERKVALESILARLQQP